MDDFFPGSDAPKLSEEEALKEASVIVEANLVDEQEAELMAAVEESLDMPISDMPMSHRHWAAVNALRIYQGNKKG